MIKTLALAVTAVLVIVVAVILVLASKRPDDFSVQRSARIQTPPERFLPLITDVRQWPAWSPWEKLDPAMERALSGAASGPGAVDAWKGPSKVGEGRMEIREDFETGLAQLKAAAEK